MIPLFMSYWFQDFYFTSALSEFTSDVPKFVSTISVDNVMKILLPYIISQILYYLSSIAISHSIPKIEINAIIKLIDYVLESTKETKTNLNTNELLMNLKKVLDTESLYHLFISYIFPTLFVAFCVCYYFFMCNFTIGMISLIVIILCIIATYYMEINGVLSSSDNEDKINIFYDDVQDIIINVDSIFSSGMKDEEIKNMNNKKHIVINTCINSNIEGTESTLKLHVVGILTAIILNGMAIKMFIDKKLNSRSVISICLMTILFMQYYDSTIDHLKRTVPQIGKFYELEEYFKKFKILKNKNINKININNNKIIFKNVTVKYDKNIILDNISLEIKENSKTGIMGQIGKGKTTILKIIAGLVNYIGLVEIDNKNLKNYEYDSIIKYVGYASQHAKLFNKDIYYNLTYGTNKSEKDIWKILKQLNLDKFYNNFPNKLKTLVGKDGSKLSGGQRQIILITRILIQNKKIILLDEPTSSLDSNIKKLMIDLLKNIKNKTLIIVTHDNDLIELFDEIIRL